MLCLLCLLDLVLTDGGGFTAYGIRVLVVGGLMFCFVFTLGV